MTDPVEIGQLPASLADWTACPVCRGSLATRIDEPGAQPHLQCAGDCQRHWYANPKPTASVLLERGDGHLLLVRRARGPFLDCWDTPGGFVDEGEEAAAAALRELREETGLDARIDDVLGIYDDTYGAGDGFHTLNVFYLATTDAPDGGVPASDVAELCWFAPDALPARDQLAFACVPLALERWRRLRAR